MVILHGLELAVFTWWAVNVLYLLIFSIASRKGKKKKVRRAVEYRRIAVLIPAYREDRVIMECVESCLQQDYPQAKYDVVVISDRMEDSTNRALAQLPVVLEIACFEQSTKAKALNLAMSRSDDYDIALILDADNTVGTDFLRRINDAFADPGVCVVQTHRVAKNRNTNLAYLDAVSEEINNSIFRQGHVNLGLSAALIGSGMAFDYGLLKRKLAAIRAVGGFDRALELTLFKEGKRIGYLPDVYVLDEKIQTHRDFTRQRRRWLSAQWHYLGAFLKDVPLALKAGSWDFCDKMFQQMSIPRLLLLGVNGMMALVLSLVAPVWAVKWWVLLAVLLVALGLAVPRCLYSRRLLVAIPEVPLAFAGMLATLFRLKGANRQFIHTEHGLKE